MLRNLTLAILLVFFWATYAMPDGSRVINVPETAGPSCTIPENQSAWPKGLDPMLGAQIKSCISCPATNACISCGGLSYCVARGSTCCDANLGSICSPNQVCVWCANFKTCQPTGSTCCNNNTGLVCQPPQKCNAPFGQGSACI